jgi:hypothetical protein
LKLKLGKPKKKTKENETRKKETTDAKGKERFSNLVDFHHIPECRLYSYHGRQ